jgi:signal transduction histidine kinase
MEAKSSVLVVDDELGSRESMRRILMSQFDVSTADRGIKAVELLKDRDFDVVVLDIRMPDMSGIETLEKIKEVRPYSGVLMVTAYASLETAKHAMRLGAYDYIEKPFKNSNELREAVLKGVEQKRAKSRTEQLAEDFDKIRKQLFQLEKLSSIGQITSEVFHELATPITGVIGYSGFLLEHECDDIIKNSLRKINTEAERCQNIIRNLLTFARKSEDDRTSININDVIRKSIDIKSYQLKMDNIQVTMNLDSNLPNIMGNFNLIQQVIMNIINNAHHAMKTCEGDRQLTVTSRCDDQNIYVSIDDTGPGIPEDKLEEIFTPFFTTKGPEEGTGLGLSISRDIIQDHDGEIYADSQEGKGTTFYIKIPIAIS